MAAHFEVDPTQQVYLLKDLLHEIEDLRLKRRDAWHGQRHPQGKRFTQEEIVQGPCPTYQNLLIGRSRRLPGRQTILEIADYLEGTLAERNTLLVAARYLPIYAEMEGIQLEQARQDTLLLLNNLPFPAYAVDRWRIYGANEMFYLSMELGDSRDFPFQYAKGPAMYFDSRVFRPFIEVTPELFVTNTRVCLQNSRFTNEIFQHEAWYQELIAYAYQFPDFANIWEHVGDTLPIEVRLTKLVPSENHHINVRSVFIRPYNTVYPSITGLVPADEDTYRYFGEMGIPVDKIFPAADTIVTHRR